LLWLPLAAAAPTSTAAKTVAAKPVLNIGVNAGPLSLDPAKNGAGTFSMVDPLRHESLIHWNADGSFSPGLARSWRYLKAKAGSGRANKDFELTLRRNARFSDGTPVTAQAVKTWLEYVSRTSGPSLVYMGGQIASVEALGTWTVRIHLNFPNPVLPYTLSDVYNWGGVNSPNAVATPPTLLTRSFGAGPYMLDPAQTVANDHYTLVPNRYYYDKSRIKWSKVVVRIIATPSSMLQAMQSGQIDVAIGDPSTAAAAAASGVTVVHAPVTLHAFTLDPRGIKSKPLADVRVRQALNYALDRKTIAAAIVGRYGKPSSAIASSDGVDRKYENFYPYNPVKARSLLAAAGYANGFRIDNVIVQAYAGNLGTPLVQAVAKYLDAVGVKLGITSYPTPGEWGRAVLGNPSAMILSPFAVSRSMWIQYGAFMKPGGLFNRVGGGWNDPAITSMWLKGQRAADPAAYWRQITARATTKALFLPVLASNAVYYVNKKVKGVVATAKRQFPLASEWSPR
jgi:peptide/nickel transport system substrate-binding protein